jgi:hypothetical protein
MDAALLGPAFGRLWPPSETSQFGRLISAIDEALMRRAWQARLDRLNRTLERNYRV